EPAEDQSAERPHEEPGGEGEQGEDVRGGVVDAREKLLGDDGRERAVQIEVVPLEYGAERCGEDDAPMSLVDAGHTIPLTSGEAYQRSSHPWNCSKDNAGAK